MALKNFMHRYGTPLTVGLFAISTISGVALFFHWSSRTFHSMHEWLSMLLLAPFALHLWKNWKPLLAYAKKKTLFIPLVLSVVVAIPFAVMASRGGGRAGNPAFQTVALMTEASLADLAPVFKAKPEELLRRAQEAGYKASSTDQSPGVIGEASETSGNDVLYALMPKSRGSRPARK